MSRPWTPREAIGAVLWWCVVVLWLGLTAVGIAGWITRGQDPCQEITDG